MKIYGSLTRLVSLIFRKDSNNITLQPNTGTYVGTTTISLPPTLTGSAVLVDETSAQAISGKTQITVGNLDLNGSTLSSSSGLNVTGASTVAVTATLNNITLTTSQSGGEIVLNPGSAGLVRMNTPVLLLQGIVGGNQPYIQMYEDPDNGTDNVRLQAPASLAGTYTLTLPPDDGDSGEVLSTNGSGVLDWVAASGASQATSTTLGTVTSFDPVVQSNFTTITNANATVTDSDGFSVFLFSTGGSDRTLTLPTAADNDGRRIRVKKIDSGAGKVIIDGESSETIDGATTYTLTAQYEDVLVMCDGSNWLAFHKKPNGSVFAQQGSGHGSTATKVRRFTNVTTVGTAISTTQSSTNGDSFTINERGIYSMTYRDRNGGAAYEIGITVNAVTLTNDPRDQGTPGIACTKQTSADVDECVAATALLEVNDVVRFMTTGTMDGGSNSTQARVTQVVRL